MYMIKNENQATEFKHMMKYILYMIQRKKILIELYRYDISQIFSNTYENQPKKGVNCSISGPQ